MYEGRNPLAVLAPADKPILLEKVESAIPQTVFYLAYGSNLSAETFLKRRGIKPVSQINVVVPHLKLTFDLPGIPYQEPCFGNTEMREDPPSCTKSKADHPSETQPLLPSPCSKPPHYHKDRWEKGLVGVVYELTQKDFIHIIETEGGGSAYRDITVTCYPLEPDSSVVPEHPSSDPVQAHTLYAPPLKPDDPPPSPGKGYRPQRPDSSYAQPSSRYLKLITDGAREHNLPSEYREYLDQIRPYKRTHPKQHVGAFVFLSVWMPFVAFIFTISPMFSDDKGRSPAWLVKFTEALFEAVWASYDGFFKKIFGDGERTEEDKGANS